MKTIKTPPVRVPKIAPADKETAVFGTKTVMAATPQSMNRTGVHSP